jgi:hypothetical protein
MLIALIFILLFYNHFSNIPELIKWGLFSTNAVDQRLTLLGCQAIGKINIIELSRAGLEPPEGLTKERKENLQIINRNRIKPV